jgi:hypothetical protein
MRLVRSIILLSVIATPGVIQSIPPSVQGIIDQSARATHEDWQRAPSFDFCEVDQDDKASRTYLVAMIAGSPFSRLVSVNGQHLTSEVAEREARRFDAAVQQRQQETPEQHQRRVAQYEKERRRDQLFLEQLTQAMEFTLTGIETTDAHKTFVVNAAPKPGYTAKSIQTAVLSGMRGKLWIDQTSFRWVKVQAEVVHPVMIEGFVARVLPGTRFELEEKPIDDREIWLPSHFSMQSRALILLLFLKSSRQDVTYFHYKANGSLSAQDCLRPE